MVIDYYICLSWRPQVWFKNEYIIILPTSKSRAQCFCRRIRSPFAKVKRRLSSITEFMFSTHKASTSPSNTMYLFSFLSVGLLISLNEEKERKNKLLKYTVTTDYIYLGDVCLHFKHLKNKFRIRGFLQCRFQYLKMLDRSPSVQSLVVGSNTP